MDRTIIGVCGKPCSGKTFLSAQLTHDLLIDCDKLAKEIFDDNPHTIQNIFEADHILTAKEVADLIFVIRQTKPEAKAGCKIKKRKKTMYELYIEWMWGTIELRIKDILRNTDAQIILIDAPLLRESGLDALCDTVITVETKDALRKERAKERGWNDGELERRDSYFN